jgi:proline iminopeptidase
MIGAHYWKNQWFLKKNQLWNELHRIHHIPCTLIHGRYDVVAIPKTSWEMHKAWPGSKLIIAPRSGHLCSEPKMTEAITAAMDKLAQRFA